MSSQNCPDCHFYTEVIYESAADNWKPSNARDQASELICTNISRIGQMLQGGRKIIRIIWANDQVMGTPASVYDNCDMWQSNEAWEGIWSVLDRIIKSNLPKGYEFLGSKFIQWRQVITIGCTLLHPNFPNGYIINGHTFSHLGPWTFPKDRTSDFSALNEYVIE